MINKSVEVPLCQTHLRRALCHSTGECLNKVPSRIPARVHTFHVVPVHWLLPNPDDLYPQSKFKTVGSGIPESAPLLIPGISPEE